MTVELPEPLATIVRKRVEAGEFPSPEDYVAALVSADQERRRRAANEALGITDEDRVFINTLLDEALDSGPSFVPGPDYKEQLLRRAREIAARDA